MTYSIIQKSQLEGALRLDAEYYQPEYLMADSLINKIGYDEFGKIIDMLTDYHANGSYESLKNNVTIKDKSDFAYMVRAVDFENNNFVGNVRYVSKSAYEFLKKSKIIGQEILIDKIGNAGAVYFMPSLNKPVTLGMNLFLVRPKKEHKPEFIYIFLNSKFGKLLIERKTTGINPKSIDKNSIRSLKIPRVSNLFDDQISNLVQNSFFQNRESKRFYQQAEDFLLEELGLRDFNEENKLFSIVNLSDCQKFNRVDAEYFLPKYEKLVSEIKNKNGKLLGNLVSLTKGFEPGSEAYQEEGKTFIRVSSLTKGGLSDGDQKYLSDELYDKLKTNFEPKIGEVLLTKDATPGIAFAIEKPIEGIISGGVLRLKTKTDIDIQYLALILNSVVGRMQAERDSGGSIIAHWRPEQIKNILIPILPPETQQKIADLVRKSHTARQKSKELLEMAKIKVEELIEATPLR